MRTLDVEAVYWDCWRKEQQDNIDHMNCSKDA
jgi:hypothetical protein